MYEGQIVFSQLIELLPTYEFRKCVERYQGNYYVKSFSCWDQFLCNEPFGVDIDETVYAFDSTTIDLCLSLFPWAKFRKHKGAIKMHTLRNLHGSIPEFIRITDGKVHDVNILDEIYPEPGSFYVMDRGYTDFTRLFRFTQSFAFFIIRAKSKLYYEKLRRVKYFDSETNKTLVFLTNNFTLPALTIAELFRCRWQIELFFKWIKQHLTLILFT